MRQNLNGSRQKLMGNLSIENNQCAYFDYLQQIYFLLIHLFVFQHA